MRVSIEKMIDNIIQNFDFERCRQAMLATNWGWWGLGTPSVETMKDSARSRLKDAVKGVLDRENKIHAGVSYIVSSGGLKATAIKNRYGYVDFLQLEFVFTDWSSD
jgi:hypothetical protein